MLPVRFSRVFVTMSVLLLWSIAFVSSGASAGAAVAPQAASTGPQCTFNGSSLPLVTGVSAGSKIAISCTGLPALHPYLFVGTSLLLGIDPAAAPLLSGQVVSLPGLLALLSALPEIDLASEAFPISDLSGNLNLTWTVPTFQPLDKNASCPPTQQEVNSGLIGCAVAMIDLTSIKPVAAGSAVLEYSGFPFLPPNPTLALSTSTAVPNQTVSVSDAPGATTYWWLSTLAALEAALGGGASSPPTVTVTLVDHPHGKVVSAPSNIRVAPATYNGSTFSPPNISGGFSIPATVAGPETVNVQVGGTLDGIPLSNSASASLFINTPPTTTVIIPSNASSAATQPSDHQGAVVTAKVSPTSAQTMDGFGASGAWWPNDLQNFPGTVQEKVAELLFSRTGIALSSYRYNVGGGGVGVTDPTRAPQTFLTSPGVYNWSADAGGMRFLRLARDHGVPILVGFVNSAPQQWTTNGKNCGGQLIPGDEGAYAAYLAEVVHHLHVADGITLSYISPMNEPDNSFGSCGQEGMAVPVGQRATVVQDLGKALAKRAPYARVIADESSLAVFQFLPEVPQWLSMSGTSEWVAALAHHTYEFPTDAQAAQVSTLGPLFDKPLWMTEICCYDGKGPLVGFGQQYDPTMTSGLWLADTIYQDIAVIGDSQFDWWTALSDQLGCDPVADRTCATDLNSSGWNDGLLYYDPNYRSDGNHSIYPTKRYSVLGNFSRYVRPGAVRHEVTGVPPGLDVLAFKDQRDWSVVVVNNNGQAVAPVRFHIALPTGNGVRCTGAFQTSSTEDLAPVERPRSVSGVGRAVQVPSQSVTTYTFEIA